MCCLAEISPFRTEFYTFVGFWVGGLGFAFTIWQVVLAKREAKKALSAAEAAKMATVQTARESQKNFHRFLGSLAFRLIREMDIHAQAENWRMAAVRAGDLAEQLELLVLHDANWTELLTTLREWNMTFIRLAEKDLKVFSLKKWLEFIVVISPRITRLQTPFAMESNE